MTNRQGAQPAYGRGSATTADASNEKADSVSQGSSSAESANHSTDKSKASSKLKQFFTLGRKNGQKAKEANENDENLRRDDHARRSSKGRSQLRHSQSIPRIKDVTYNVQDIDNQHQWTSSNSVQRLGPTAKQLTARDDVDPSLTQFGMEARPLRAVNGDSLQRAHSDNSQQRGASGERETNARETNGGKVEANGSSRHSSLRTIGIVNHGNSCFMNAVVQSLRHADILARYFALELYRQQAAINGVAKRGSKKQATTPFELSDAFAALISALWRAEYSSADSQRLKTVAGRLCEQYRSSTQQDAQEFLLWLLSTLDDELQLPISSRSSLNAKRKAAETAKKANVEDGKTSESSESKRRSTTKLELVESYRKNQSELWRRVAGFYESTLVCPVCSKTSATYEPYSCLSLPVAQRNYYVVDVVFPRSVTHLANRTVTEKYDVPIWQIRVACSMNSVDSVLALKSSLREMSVLRLHPDQSLLIANIPTTLNWVRSLPDSTKLGDLEHNSFHAFVLDPTPSGSTSRGAESSQSQGGSKTSEESDAVTLVVLNVERYVEPPNTQFFVRQWTRPLVLSNISRSITFWPLIAEIVNALLGVREQRVSSRKRSPVLETFCREELRQSLTLYTIEDENNTWLQLKSSSTPLLCDEVNRLIAPTRSTQSLVQTARPVRNSSNNVHIKLVVEWGSAARIEFFNRHSAISGCLPALAVEDELALGIYKDTSLNELSVAASNGSAVSGQKLLAQSDATSLTECFKMNFRDELLGNDDAWMCPQCKRLQAGAKKKLSLLSVADLLIIHLKRFRHTEGKRAKIDCLVDFPLDGLDMTAFCTGSETCNDETVIDSSSLNAAESDELRRKRNGIAAAKNGISNGLHNNLEGRSDSNSQDAEDEEDEQQQQHDEDAEQSEYENVEIINEVKKAQKQQLDGRQVVFEPVDEQTADSLLFDLVAVVNHYGTLQSGHYTAYCRYPPNAIGNQNGDRDLWFAYDDQTVTQKRPDEVCTPAAYLLIYQRRNTKADSVPHWSLRLQAQNTNLIPTSPSSTHEETKKRNDSNDSLKVVQSHDNVVRPEAPSVASTAGTVKVAAQPKPPDSLPPKPIKKSSQPLQSQSQQQSQNNIARVRVLPPTVSKSSKPTPSLPSRPPVAPKPFVSSVAGPVVSPPVAQIPPVDARVNANANGIPAVPARNARSPATVTSVSTSNTSAPVSTGVRFPKRIAGQNQPNAVERQPSNASSGHEVVEQPRPYDPMQYQESENPAIAGVYSVNDPVAAHIAVAPPVTVQNPETKSSSNYTPSVALPAASEPAKPKPPRYKNGILITEAEEKKVTPNHAQQMARGQVNPLHEVVSIRWNGPYTNSTGTARY